MLTDALPRISLAHLPTPLEELPRLRAALGGGPRLWIKRDDQTGLATGGNKARKLEFLVAEALERGADTLVTVGAAQSNHCRQTAAAAARVGLRCALVLSGHPPPRPWNGNLLLHVLLGAELHWVGDGERSDAAAAVVEGLRAEGARPFFFGVGGSVPTGAAGYVAAVEELYAQLQARSLSLDRIVFASGSAGTQAGILVGVQALGMETRVEGIDVSAVSALRAEILALAAIAQLIRPGTPVVYGMSSSVPDMRSGVNLAGAVEIGLLGAAVAQLARRCGLPCLMSSGTDAHAPGAQAMMERLMTFLFPALAGIDLINLTTLETKMTLSLEQWVIEEEVLNAVERLLQGITVDDESLALDVIQEIGPKGAFVTVDHTLRHFREELLTPNLFHRQPRDAWEAAGAPDMQTRAREQARRILAEHHPPSLPDDVAVQLDAILKGVEADRG